MCWLENTHAHFICVDFLSNSKVSRRCHLWKVKLYSNIFICHYFELTLIVSLCFSCFSTPKGEPNWKRNEIPPSGPPSLILWAEETNFHEKNSIEYCTFYAWVIADLGLALLLLWLRDSNYQYVSSTYYHFDLVSIVTTWSIWAFWTILNHATLILADLVLDKFHSCLS